MDVKKNKPPYSMILAGVLFLVLFVTFVFGCVEVVKADVLTEEMPDFVGYLEDNGYDCSNMKYYVVRSYDTSQRIDYICTESKPDFIYSNGYESLYFANVFYWVMYYPATDTFELGSYNGRSNFTYEFTTGLKLLYSNYDVYSPDGSLFFLQTPCPTLTLVGGLAVPEITTLAMKELIGVIPLVLGLVVLATSLYKGLSSLWRLLITRF